MVLSRRNIFILFLLLTFNKLFAQKDSLAVNTLNPEGTISNWLLLGPFPSGKKIIAATGQNSRTGFDIDFLNNIGGEAHATLKRGIPVNRNDGSQNGTKTPVFLKATIQNGNHLLYADFDYSVGYAYCELFSEKEQTVYGYFGSDGSPKIYINGQKILEHWAEMHHNKIWQYPFKITLHKGNNNILVKLDNDRGYWGFRLNLIKEESHLNAFKNVWKGFSLKEFKAENQTISLVCLPEPIPLDISPEIQITIKDKNEQVISSETGTCGQKIKIKIPGITNDIIHIEIQSKNIPSVKSKFLRFAGNFEQRRQELKNESANLDLDYLTPHWKEIHLSLKKWIDYFLNNPIPQPDDWATRSLLYSSTFMNKVHERVNFANELNGNSFPVRLPDNAVDYTVVLPKKYAENNTFPLIINLHGTGGVGQKISFQQTVQASDGGQSFKVEDEELSGFIKISPIATQFFWDSRALNQMLDAVKKTFNIDTNRIYLQGHSMGGFGTFSWAIDNPEHFAAISPWSGGGEVYRAVRLTNVPCWAFHGNKDTDVPPYLTELMVDALLEIGAEVKYTNFPELGHGIGSEIDKSTLQKWYLQHKKSLATAPADPLAAIKFGVDSTSEIEIKNETKNLFITSDYNRSLTLNKNIEKKSLLLYDLYRSNFGKISGYIELIVNQNSIQKIGLKVPKKLTKNIAVSYLKSNKSRYHSFYLLMPETVSEDVLLKKVHKKRQEKGIPKTEELRLTLLIDAFGSHKIWQVLYKSD